MNKGQKVRLKDFGGYKGGLDVRGDMTGQYRYVQSKINDITGMYSVQCTGRYDRTYTGMIRIQCTRSENRTVQVCIVYKNI